MADLRSAAFRTDPFSVRGYTWPHLNAARWLDLLSTGAWPVRLIQAMDGEAHERLLADVESGALAVPDGLLPLAREVLSEAAGRPWWEVETLVSTCYGGDGRVLGMVLLSGIDPGSVTLASFCCAVWAQVTKGADGIELMKAEAQLKVPPPEVTAEELEQQPEEDMAAMVERMRAMSGARIG